MKALNVVQKMYVSYRQKHLCQVSEVPDSEDSLFEKYEDNFKTLNSDGRTVATTLWMSSRNSSAIRNIVDRVCLLFNLMIFAVKICRYNHWRIGCYL